MQIKICGITHPDDALMAAKLGANYIGMIFSKSSKRNVSHALGKEIADAARMKDAEPVGVFVEATFDEILLCCELTGITTVQLQGDLARQHASRLDLNIFYAIPDLFNYTTIPLHVIPLFDNGGGTGKTFDWKTFVPPKDKNWFLAGGLTPSNVHEAIRTLSPYGVDVSSGVEYKETRRKDPGLVAAFIKEAMK